MQTRGSVNAYVLASDPAWLTVSVGAYYQHVDRIVVSYDESGHGWTGRPVHSSRCISELKAVDLDRKLILVPGDYRAKSGESPLEAETRQRNVARLEAAKGADWVIQIDTDEYLPSFASLVQALEVAAQRRLPAVDWPMRVLYRATRSGRFLEVVNADGSVHTDYPGHVAIRPDLPLVHARRSAAPFLRPVLIGDRSSLTISREPEEGEERLEVLTTEDAILHNSWARGIRDTWAKVSSWGHNDGYRTQVYFVSQWLPSPLTWRLMRNFHPISPEAWPRLARTRLAD